MEHVLIVHGDDGLDEITISSETVISELKNNKIHEYKISPKILELIFQFDDIIAHSAEESLMLVKEAFSGKNSAVQDMIALNSGAALYVAGIVRLHKQW
jgi:anthranilate phosphoribosyltransferase